MRLNETDFLNELLLGMDASSAFQTPSTQSTQPPPSLPPSTASTTRQSLTQVSEIQQLLQGADEWDWNDDLEDNSMLEGVNEPELFGRLPERIAAPAVTEQYLPQPYTRCVVVSIEEITTPRSIKTLTVRADGMSQAHHHVILSGDWVFTDVAAGDVINVIGSFSKSTLPRIRSSIEINAHQNFLILHPDILMTATSISNSAHCQRRPIISSLLASEGSSSPAVVWGTMLHEIMQICLAEDRWDDKFINMKTDEVARGRLADLLKLDLDLDAAKEEIRKRANGLQGFSKRFIGSKPKDDAVLLDSNAKKGNETLLAICGLHDTEEDIWSPRFGLKGKLDASVQAVLEERGKGKPAQPRKLSVPLEIKTGRNGSIEHRAQTMLYTILMEERYGTQVPAGLLYYTQSDEVIRVNVARNELRSLIQNRNRMVAHMMKRSADPKPDAVPGTTFLPPTEDDEFMCRRCYASDACMLYRKAVEAVEDHTSPIADMYNAKTEHLTPTQCGFFKQWEHLIALEEQDIIRFRRELWTMGAEEREKTGRCFANMVIVGSGDHPTSKSTKLNIHRHTYTFSRKPQSQAKVAVGSSVLSILNSQSRMVSSNFATAVSSASTDRSNTSLLTGQISKGDAVTISIEPEFLSLARGYVLNLDRNKITVGVDHELDVKAIYAKKYGDAEISKRVDGVVFRIDRDELAAGIGRIRNNLAQLFYKSGDTKRLELVVDLKRPEFDEGPQDLSHVDERVQLNHDQRLAMEKVLSAKDYAILLGMPGTGKTSTVSEIIKELVRRGKSVLLASYTHSAVDTILMKLQNVDFEILRLGNADKIHPDVFNMSLAARPTATSVEMLERQLLTPPVVATTCLSTDHTLFSRRRFDVCIVDEASQITLPTCLGPLRFADKFVLVGDHHQLPPLVRSSRARQGGLDVSLFRRLSEAHPHAVVELKHQYRMNEDVMKVSNTLIYDNKLNCGNEEVAKRSLNLRHPSALSNFHVASSMECAGVKCWLRDLLDSQRRVVFVDTDSVPAKESRVGELVQNEVEAKLVAQLVKALIRGGVDESQIGVLSLYRQQIKLLSHLIEPHRGIETLTADQSQGRDKDCIIISMCRSNDSNSIGDLLKDWRRLNVSFTRARSKLVIFGSRKTLSNIKLLRDFFELMERESWIYHLPPRAHLTHETKAFKRKRDSTALDEEDKENTQAVIRPSLRKRPRLEVASRASAVTLLKGREMLKDVVMDIQIL